MGKKSKQQKQAELLALQNAQQQNQLALEQSKLGREQFAASQATLAPVNSFWKTLLSGNRDAMLELLAPELSSITDAAEGARRSQATLTPRGGARVSARANINDSTQRDINNVLFGVRPQAATQMTTLGSLLGGQGINLFGQGSSGFAQSGQGSLNLANFLNAQRSNIFGQLLGSAIGTIMPGVGSAIRTRLESLIRKK